jgi:predicted Na+-dependent transporter
VTGALAWLGARARGALVIGIALCFMVPELSRFLRPALPFLVPLVLGLAMARIDLAATLSRALQPGRLALLLAICLVLMPLGAVLYLLLARLFGLDPALSSALVYLAAAPPIASAGALCFILGFNAALAVELTVAATLLTPLLGPSTVALVLPSAAAIAPLDLALRLGLMIAAAGFVALAIRRGAGPARLARHAGAMDGIGVIALVVFVIPLFDGVPAMILDAPARALEVLGVAVLANIGVTLAVRALLLRGARLGAADAGAAGIVSGNRTIAIYLAALPPDPAFALFVALYQVPMLLTPAILQGLGIRKSAAKGHTTI